MKKKRKPSTELQECRAQLEAWKNYDRDNQKVIHDLTTQVNSNPGSASAISAAMTATSFAKYNPQDYLPNTQSPVGFDPPLLNAKETRMTDTQLLDSIAATISPLPGWCDLDRVRMLAQLVLDHKITNALLIGVYGGRDTFAIALAMQHRGEGVIHGVDPWSPSASAAGMDGQNAEWWGNLDHEQIWHGFMRKRAELGLVPFSKVLRMTNREAEHPLRGERFGLVVIDGNHGEESVWDVEHFFPLLDVGGFIYLDDVDWSNECGPSVRDAVKRIETMGVEKVRDVGTGRLYRKVAVAPTRKDYEVELGRNLNLGGGWLPYNEGTYCPAMIAWLCSVFPIHTVLDVGCGGGEALRSFRANGCSVLGLEGLELVARLTDVPTIVHDLEKGPVKVAGIDLVYSLETAEHVDNTDAFIETLCNGKMVVMCHAQPGQEGHHHTRCLPEEFWIEKMKAKGYRYLIELSEHARRRAGGYFGATGKIFMRDGVDWGTAKGDYREA